MRIVNLFTFIFQKESQHQIQQKYGYNGRIPERELNRLLEIVPLYYLKIVSKWREKYGDDEVKFYC